jgi:predicted dehydrogenase
MTNKSSLKDFAKTIRLGIVGCGGIAQLRHLPALSHAQGIEVIALSDLDEARLESIAAQFGVARRFKNYRELIESNEVDAVAVCVPTQFHAEVAMAALAAGKHVLVEKPLALTLDECDLLIERATRNESLKVLIGFNLRWHRLVLEARERIHSGELGKIKLVRTVFTNGARHGEDFADWRRRRESGGGAIFELGVHHFDLLRFLLGSEAAEVYASSAPADETAVVSARMESGALVAAAFSESACENHEIEVYGDKGWLRVACYRADGLEHFDAGQFPGAMNARLEKLKRTVFELPHLIGQARRGGDYVNSYTEQWRHFVDAITNDAPVQSTLDDGRRASWRTVALDVRRGHHA